MTRIRTIDRFTIFCGAANIYFAYQCWLGLLWIVKHKYLSATHLFSRLKYTADDALVAFALAILWKLLFESTTRITIEIMLKLVCK